MKYFFNDKDEFFREAAAAIRNVDIVLDIGSGIRPQPFVQSLTHICCEPYHEYVEFLMKENKNIVAIRTTWEHIVEIMPEKSVDSIFLLDVIEHLPKERGKDLLNKTLRIARDQVVIFTPLGYVKQHHKDGKDAWGFNGVEWQEHHSGWFPKDFSEDWDLYICEKFHDHDNIGRELLEPFGAFWAIWNNSKNKAISNKETQSIDQPITHKVMRKIESIVNQEIALKDLMKLLGKIEVYSRNKGEIITWIQLLDTINMLELRRDYYRNIDNYLKQTEYFKEEEKGELQINNSFQKEVQLIDKKIKELEDTLKSLIQN
ncbi:MAG: hypothetical protein MJA31_09345 [Clostridia bacterium]|nr:hypothetical protein [Clostridia bacterium]